MFFSSKQGGDYKDTLSGGESSWQGILDDMTADGWELASGPTLLSVTFDQQSDIVSAGFLALIIEGCTQYWQAVFVKKE